MIIAVVVATVFRHRTARIGRYFFCTTLFYNDGGYFCILVIIVESSLLTTRSSSSSGSGFLHNLITTPLHRPLPPRFRRIHLVFKPRPTLQTHRNPLFLPVYIR